MSLLLNSDEVQAGRQQSIWLLRKMAAWRIGALAADTGRAGSQRPCDPIFPAVGAAVRSQLPRGPSPRSSLSSLSGRQCVEWASGLRAWHRVEEVGSRQILSPKQKGC